MSKTISQEDLENEFMEEFKQPIGQIKQKLNSHAQSGTLPSLRDMDEVLTDLKNHGHGWGKTLGKTLGKKGGRKSRSHTKRTKTKKRTHKKRKAKRTTKRRARRSQVVPPTKRRA